MAATLFLQTQQGQIAIHNVYNVNQPAKDDRPKRHIDVKELVKDTTRAAKTLEDEMIIKAKMALLTKPGTVTCTRGGGNDHSTASCIDLTFISRALLPQVKHWGVFQDNPWKPSDHRPIRTVLDMRCGRDDSRILLWNRVNSRAFLEAVAMGLCQLDGMPVVSRQDVDAFASALIQIIYESSPVEHPQRSPQAVSHTLADRSVATWFLRVMHLFLSDRSIVLKLPQSVSDPFFVNIGIPQGSPLSPLLFLLYTAPLLIMLAEKIKKLDRPNVKVHVFAYVDDTYIMAVSPSYEENCSILKKSLVMHFQRGVSDAKQKSDQRKRKDLGLTDTPEVESPCTLLPEIDELRNNPECLQQEKLLVLGLMLDPKLSFEHHLTHIEEKVKAALRYQRRISGANWGMTLERTRQYYICKIRPVVSYACAAWFVWRPYEPGLPGLHCSLPTGQMARLQKLPYKCIMLLSGAIRATPRCILQKECFIDSIEVFLYRMSMSCRAKSLKVRPHDFWFNKLPEHDEDGRFHEKFHDYNESAFDVLNRGARVLFQQAGKRFQDTWKCPPKTIVLEAWRNPVNRNRAIRQQAIRQATETSEGIR
ncbi:hypothetical protein FDENT_2307 [Fusarium denticulatum]|uniref:Reverse transcriptase domain-containing protein n=1 Tax=Fusarium denticulatum TaxID=48507 RepID=A0A8H5XGB3_9HYPO|nr:hypothetical protein FDENT_2307 [Fusarium denticulatum]